LFWFLKAWTTNLSFLNVLSTFEYLMLFTKRMLKIRTLKNTSALLTDKKISFSSRSTIFCCLDAMNDDDESTMIELRIKLRYVIKIEYFLDRSWSRFNDSMNIIDDWDIIEPIMKLFWDSMIDDIFDADTLNESVFDDDDEFSSSSWSFWLYDLTEIDRNFVDSLDNSIIADSLCMLSSLKNSFHDFHLQNRKRLMK
jgi:hypothetical protein